MAQEKKECRKSGVKHSQRLFELRDLAIRELGKPPKESNEPSAHV